MFYEMRRKDRVMDEIKTQALIEACDYGILSTISESGYPYGVPVNYSYINKKIYFHGTNAGGNKYDNICYSDKVCFTIIGKTEVKPEQFSTNYESAVIFGKVRVIKDTDEKKRILESILMKYSGEFRNKGLEYIDKACDAANVYEITPEKITGKERSL